MRFISEVYWSRGERSVNQDSISLQEISVKGKRIIFALVCDGIGGLWSGEAASGFVAERMTEWFYKEAAIMFEKRRSIRRLRLAGSRALYSCGMEMLEYAQRKKISFGTAATMLIIYNGRYLLWHCGDTRVYQISGSKKRTIVQLTKDHALDSHTLTRCIGSFRFQKPDMESHRIWRKSTFLICSDGFRHVISQKRLGEALQPCFLDSREQIYRRLKEIARYSEKQGETDNISAVAIRVGDSGEE